MPWWGTQLGTIYNVLCTLGLKCWLEWKQKWHAFTKRVTIIKVGTCKQKILWNLMYPEWGVNISHASPISKQGALRCWLWRFPLVYVRRYQFYCKLILYIYVCMFMYLYNCINCYLFVNWALEWIYILELCGVCQHYSHYWHCTTWSYIWYFLCTTTWMCDRLLTNLMMWSILNLHLNKWRWSKLICDGLFQHDYKYTPDSSWYRMV